MISHTLRRILPTALALMAAAPPATSADKLVPPDWVEYTPESSWCGANGIWLLAHSFGIDAPLDEVKRLCDPTGKSGGELDLVHLGAAAQSLGLHALPVACKLDWLAARRLPALTLHCYPVKKRDGNSSMVNHFLVFVDRVGDEVRIVDPGP